MKDLLAGKDIDYEGAWGPIDWDRTATRAPRFTRSGGTRADRFDAETVTFKRWMRTAYREGGGFEQVAAYSRAARAGNWIAVSGDARALGPDGAVLHPGDAEAQAREAIRRALAAVEELGGRREDVLRTRLWLAEGADWEGPIRAHREAFEGVDPANTTLYVAGFLAARRARRGRGGRRSAPPR